MRERIKQMKLAGCLAIAEGSLSKMLLRLLLTKVTKHILPQTSPVGSSLAGI